MDAINMNLTLLYKILSLLITGYSLIKFWQDTLNGRVWSHTRKRTDKWHYSQEITPKIGQKLTLVLLMIVKPTIFL